MLCLTCLLLNQGLERLVICYWINKYKNLTFESFFCKFHATAELITLCWFQSKLVGSALNSFLATVKLAIIVKYTAVSLLHIVSYNLSQPLTHWFNLPIFFIDGFLFFFLPCLFPSNSTITMSSTELTPEERYDLITKNLEEVLNGQIIKNVLENENRPLKIYWGMSLIYVCSASKYHFSTLPYIQRHQSKQC